MFRNKKEYPEWYPMDDDILINAHRGGDRSAFEVLVKKHQDSVARLCYSIVKNDTVVPDVVQDVFLAVHRGLKNFRGDASFKTWLYKITVNESFRYLKKAKKHDRLFQSTTSSLNSDDSTQITLVFMDHRESPERMLLNAQKKQLIVQAIDKLSENHRLVLYLHYQQDSSVYEIAEILDIPLGSVKSRLFYARIHLKELLTPFFDHTDQTDALEGEKNAM